MVTISTITNKVTTTYSAPTVAAPAATSSVAPAATPAVTVTLSAKLAAPVQAAASVPSAPLAKQGLGLGARTITLSNYNAANQVTIYDGATKVFDSSLSGPQAFSGPVINGKTAQFTLAQANILDPFFQSGVTGATYTPQFTVQFTNGAGVSSPASILMRNPVPVYDVTSDTNVQKYNSVVSDPTLLPASGFNQLTITDNGAALSRNFSKLLDMTQDNSGTGGLPAAITGIRYAEMARPTLTLGVTDILKGDALKIASGASAGKPYFYAITSSANGTNPAFIQPTEHFSIDDAISLSADTVKLFKTMNIDVSADDLDPANAPNLAEKVAKLNALFATEGALPPGQVSKFKLNITAAVSDVQSNIDVLGRLTRLNKISLVSDVDHSVAMPSTTPFTISADQYKYNKPVLAVIGTNYQLHLNGVKAADATAMLKDSHILDFSVEDSMSNVLANATVLNKIPKNFTLAIKDTIKNTVAFSSNLGLLTKPYTLNITDATLDKVLQNSSVLSKLKVSYNLRDKTSEVIAHADDLVKFTQNVTLAKSLSNWQNSSVVDTAAAATTPAVTPFVLSLSNAAAPQLLSIVEGSAPVDQILVDVPDASGVSNYYGGLTLDKSNNLMQNGRIVGALVKTKSGNQTISQYSLIKDASGNPIATASGTTTAGATAGTSTFNWLPPTTFVPSDGKHNYQLVADPAVPASDTNFGLKINGLMTTGSASLARSFTINVVSASVGGSNGLAARYTSADPSFYMIHDSESALAHLDLSANTPFATLLASGRLLGAVSADGAPQGLTSTTPPVPPAISVPRTLNVATGKLNATLIPVIGYDHTDVSNDGIVAKFKNGLTLNGASWQDAPVLDSQSNVAEMVINSPISSIYNPATGVDNTAIMKSISKVLKINVQIDKDTTAAQITSLSGVSSVPGKAITIPAGVARSTPPLATDPVTVPTLTMVGQAANTILDPDLTINGVPIFKSYDPNQHIYFDPNSPPASVLQDIASGQLPAIQSVQDKIKTVQDVIDAINTAVTNYKDYLKTHESAAGADQSYKNVDLTAAFDSISGGVILYSQTTPTINAVDNNNIMAFTGLNFSNVQRPTGASGAISLAGVPVGSAPKGQASGQVLVTVKDASGASLASHTVDLSLGNNPQKNITSIINAINSAFGYSGSTQNYVLRATSDGTLNGGVKLSSMAGDQITVDYPNDLTNVLGVQFGSISKYLQISTLDASVLAPPDIQTALSTFPNNFVLNVIDTQSNISANQLAIDTAGRGQAKITLQN